MEPFLENSESSSPPKVFLLSKWMSRYPQLTVGITSRRGGVSVGEHASLNCGLHVGDLADAVTTNRKCVADVSGISIDNWVYAEQTHTSTVAVVSEGDRGKGIRDRSSALQETDAFVTRTKDLCLAAMFADCVPLYFFDPVHEVIGLAHAGWKGTAAQIARRTVEKMCQAFGSLPEDIIAAIGPSIRACCYEVDSTLIQQMDRTLDQVMASDKPIPNTEQHHSRESFYTQKSIDKYNLDLQQVNRQIMIKAGILPTSIEMTEWCTSCGNDQFYSHRKEQGKTGRMVAWIGMGSGLQTEG